MLDWAEIVTEAQAQAFYAKVKLKCAWCNEPFAIGVTRVQMIDADKHVHFDIPKQHFFCGRSVCSDICRERMKRFLAADPLSSLHQGE